MLQQGLAPWKDNLDADARAGAEIAGQPCTIVTLAETFDLD